MTDQPEQDPPEAHEKTEGEKFVDEMQRQWDAQTDAYIRELEENYTKPE